MGQRPGALEGVDVNSLFWAGRRVFVTGHTGFKGGWLSLWLQDLGAEVTGYALSPPTKPSLFETARIGEGMRSLIADVRDLGSLVAAVTEAQPEVVFHLAAQPLVRKSYRKPVETYATNVMGTVHLLEAVRQTPSVRAVINVTSDKCYENREWLWGYREIEPMGGHDPYSNSKGCSELVTAAWRDSFYNPARHGKHGVAIASARAGNVIGGGDWAEERLVPDLLRAFELGRPAVIRHPDAVRPWQHVLEPLSGYLRLAERLVEAGPDHAEAWNFGPDDEAAVPVRLLADHLCQAWGAGAAWQHEAGEHPHEAALLRLDSTKARTRLDWRPRWSLAKALEATADWHRACLAGEDCRAKALDQIREYLGGSVAGETIWRR